MSDRNSEDIIGALYDMVQDARSMPLAADKCILERDKVLDMLDEIIAQLPAELKQSRTIVEARNELISQARREAENIVRQAQEQEKAVQINSGDVQALVLSNSSGTAAFLNTPMGVIADGDDAGLYSQQKLISLVYGLTHIDADMEINEPDADSFGFDTPAAQVSILLDNSTVRLTLGRRSPVAEEYYLKNEDSGKVYLVSAASAETR